MKSRNRDRESQPIFLPIIFGVAALSAGAFGLSKGAEGAGSMLEAEEKRKKLVKLYETYQNRLKGTSKIAKWT